MEKPVQSHRELRVWQKAVDLVVEIYKLAAKFPRSETYRLGAQITRAAASVPANIAAFAVPCYLFPVTCSPSEAICHLLRKY